MGTLIRIGCEHPRESWVHGTKLSASIKGRGLRGMVITKHKPSMVFPTEPFCLFRDSTANETFCIPVTAFTVVDSVLLCEHEEFKRMCKHVIARFK